MHYRLTKMDEWPRHQTGGTFDVVSDGSPHWSDGYYFTMGSDDGAIAWFSGFRLHANNDVLDCFTCISADGQQHNMRWSRRLRPSIDDLTCGPVSVEIIEGLRTIRTVCEPNEYGIAHDLTWEGFAEPYNEERVISIINGRLHSDRSNYDQCSVVSGWIEFAGRRVDVDGWTGVRDHSWGIGNSTGGPRSSAIAPAPRTEQVGRRGLRQWCVFKMPDRVLFWQFQHTPDGEYTLLETQCLYPYADGRAPFAYRSLSHEVQWETVDGTPVPRMAAGNVTLERPDGGTERYAVQRISYPVYMQGGGYFGGFDDGLGRGVYRGELHHEGEVWDVSHPVQVIEPKGLTLQPHAWAESWGRCTNLDDVSDTGTGHLECVAIGHYPGLDGTK